MVATVMGEVVPAVLGAVGQVAADAGDDASRRLSVVIIGLVVLALVIAAATVVFWRLTRPDATAPSGGIRWVTEDGSDSSPGQVPPASAISPVSPPPATGAGGATGTPPFAG